VVIIAEFAAARLDFLSDSFRQTLHDFFFLCFLAIGLMFAWRLTMGMFDWYGREIAARTHANVDQHLMPFFRRIALVLVVLLAMSVLLSHFGVDVSGLVATLGIGSLAIALAAQAALEDTISGFLIIVDRPFRVGDRIELHDLDTWGDVEDIGLRSSRIRLRDNRTVIVPNSVIGRSLVINHSYPNNEYRIHIDLGLAYGSDIEKARKVLCEAVSAVPGVLADKPVEALFIKFGDSTLIFRVRWWIESYAETRRMYDKVNTAVYNALNAANIEIPFPQADMNLHIDEGTVLKARQIANSAPRENGGGE
jgi:MscS family membrane protein